MSKKTLGRRKALVQARHCGGIEEDPFGADLSQRARGGLVRRLLLRRLQLPAQGRPVTLRKSGQDVLALLPLPALQPGRRPEHLADRRVQPFGAGGHDEEAEQSRP